MQAGGSEEEGQISGELGGRGLESRESGTKISKVKSEA